MGFCCSKDVLKRAFLIESGPGRIRQIEHRYPALLRDLKDRGRTTGRNAILGPRNDQMRRFVQRRSKYLADIARTKFLHASAAPVQSRMNLARQFNGRRWRFEQWGVGPVESAPWQEDFFCAAAKIAALFECRIGAG